MHHANVTIEFPDAIKERTVDFLVWYQATVLAEPTKPLTYAEYDGLGLQWDIEGRVGCLVLCTAGVQRSGSVWLDQIDAADLPSLAPPPSLLLRVWADLACDCEWITPAERRDLAGPLSALAVGDIEMFGEPIYA
jgi:hypothetical protein